MKRILTLLIVVLLSCLLLGREAESSTKPKAENGFELLFNGKDLKGWIIQGEEGEKPEIEDGVLKIDGYFWWAIISKKKFKDFVLRCDVLIEPNGNTGILFHTPEEEVFLTSPEIQFCDDVGAKPSKKGSGAIFKVKAPTKNAIKKAGEWNEVEITVKNNHLTVILNGEKVQDTNLKGLTGIKHKYQEGGIALQRKDDKIKAAYRNIRVKNL